MYCPECESKHIATERRLNGESKCLTCNFSETTAYFVAHQPTQELAYEDVLSANIPNKNSTINNGGKTDYYDLNPKWIDGQDIIEGREMNYAQGNIFKVAFTFGVGRHSGTNYERDLNKVVYFAQRELDRIKK